ncbi:MAG TPA: helix-turn-helix transcriptional regulator [Xanthobacteraceae bacterium]|jgi:transcriptional regulator with XRE-family HTH domain
MLARKKPNPTDRYVGARVRMRRLMLGMSQTTLGEALGLTFQQVQKYEKGTNRIGASRLQQISHALQVPISFFFEELPVATKSAAEPGLSPSMLTGFLATSEGLALVDGFIKIRNGKLRRRIVDLVERIAET